MVVVTSIRAARRRLRYESWHLLHLYAYLGVGLALPHQLWTGADFLSSPLATVYWWSLWAAAAGAILVLRVALPLYRIAAAPPRRRARSSAEGSGVVSVHLRGRDLDRLGASAGQFFIWRFLDGPGWTRGNPYSLSAAPDPRPPADHRQGPRRRQRPAGPPASAGTRVLIEGPYGRLHAGVRTRRKVTLLAGGIGVTPLRALLEELDAGPRRRHAGLPRPQRRRPRAPPRDRRDRRPHGRPRSTTPSARGCAPARPGCPSPPHTSTT